MTWFQQSANETEAARAHVQMFLAVDFDFPSGHLRVWTGWGDLLIGADTYTGTGLAGSIASLADQSKLVAEEKAYRLSGVDPSIITEADIDDCFGRSVTERFGFLTTAGALVATPEINWEGRMDCVNRVDSAEPYIEVVAKNRLAWLDRPNGWRYTHEHQQLFYSGDNGLNLIPTTMTAEIQWGGAKVNSGVLNTKVAVLQAKRGGG